MTEATGYEAQTIHRLLEVNVNPEEAENSGGFLRNRQNPLEADVIIIDEMSMVDLTLMHALLSAVIPGTRLILCRRRRPTSVCGTGKRIERYHCIASVSCCDTDSYFSSGRRK